MAGARKRHLVDTPAPERPKSRYQYCKHPTPAMAAGNGVRAARMQGAISMAKLAQLAGIDEKTLRRVEERRLSKRLICCQTSSNNILSTFFSRKLLRADLVDLFRVRGAHSLALR